MSPIRSSGRATTTSSATWSSCRSRDSRGEFAFAQNAIVEHFHPHWGNAERDSTYTKAMRDTNGDRKLYMERMGIRPRRISQKVLERQERLKAARATVIYSGPC